MRNPASRIIPFLLSLIVFFLLGQGEASAYVPRNTGFVPQNTAPTPQENLQAPGNCVWDCIALPAPSEHLGQPFQVPELQLHSWQPDACTASDVRCGPNLYAYFNGNPWTAFDPEGLAAGTPTGYENSKNQRDWSTRKELYGLYWQAVGVEMFNSDQHLDDIGIMGLSFHDTGVTTFESVFYTAMQPAQGYKNFEQDMADLQVALQFSYVDTTSAIGSSIAEGLTNPNKVAETIGGAAFVAVSIPVGGAIAKAPAAIAKTNIFRAAAISAVLVSSPLKGAPAAVSAVPWISPVMPGAAAVATASLEAFDAAKTPLFSSATGEAMDPVALARIKTAFGRTGGIIDQSAEAQAYLRLRGAEGVTFGKDTILLPAQPTRSAVFEELIHTVQNRTGRFTGDNVLQMEIEAAEKLIRFRRGYGIPNSETRATIDRLRGMRTGTGQ